MIIEFGAFASPLHKQYKQPKKKFARIQRFADAINLLRLHGILTDGESHKTRQRLIKKIGEVVNE